MKKEVLFWDFDGVILNSNDIRREGFQRVLKDYPASEVAELLAYHDRNGGLSRYVKFSYFFEEIRGEEKLTDERLAELTRKFSEIMIAQLGDPALLINETVAFIRQNYDRYTFHIVSGSDGKELNAICDTLDLSRYFLSINGSPTPKIELVRTIVHDYQYPEAGCLLIGDSINDFEAADENGISFMAYNNASIEHLSNHRIDLSSPDPSALARQNIS